jgi:hypothetical protein
MPSERADRLTGGHSFISSRNASSERPVSLATRSHKLHQAMVVAPIPPSHFGSSKSSAIASAMCLGVYIENSPRIGVRFAPVDVRGIRLRK